MLKNYFGKTFPALLSFKSCYSFTFLFVLFTSTLFSQGTTCGTATTLTVNGACLTSTSNNITDTTQNSPIIGTCSGTVAREGWYTFTVTGGPLNITITAEANNRNLFLQLISSTASCTGLSQIACAIAQASFFIKKKLNTQIKKFKNTNFMYFIGFFALYRKLIISY